MSYKIIVPMFYTNSKNETGIFDKRNGKNKLVIVTVDNITLLPFFDKLGQDLSRFVIRATLKAKPKQLVIPAKDYQFSTKLSISGFKANVEYTLQIRLVQTKSIAEKDKALAGQKPKIVRIGTLNQFKFKYVPGLDSSDIVDVNAQPEISTPATDDLLAVPANFNRVVKPKDPVF